MFEKKKYIAKSWSGIFNSFVSLTGSNHQLRKSTNSELSEKKNCIWPMKYQYTKPTSLADHWTDNSSTSSLNKSTHLSCSPDTLTNSETMKIGILNFHKPFDQSDYKQVTFFVATSLNWHQVIMSTTNQFRINYLQR